MNLTGYATFRKTVMDLTGIDLDCYKGTQMERRLQSLLRRTGADDLNAYARVLAGNPVKVKEFQDFLTINVSEWLRNAEKFEELQRTILPDLLGNSPRLRIWSAGCSNGSEPYSVAMLLDELDPNGRHEVIGTDLDLEILKAAQAGVYSDKDVKNVSAARRAKYLVQDGDRFTVKPLLRTKVRFERQNLLADPPLSDVDLILCRNVVIYFTEEAKDQLYRKFHQSLKRGGILLVGGTESLLRAREMGYVSVSPFFYRVSK